MAVADALRSQAAWSCKKRARSARTAESHAGGVRDRTRQAMLGTSLSFPGIVRRCSLAARVSSPSNRRAKRMAPEIGDYFFWTALKSRPMALVHGGRLVAQALKRHGITH